MQLSTVSTLPAVDFLTVQLDGDNVPFYPHFLAHPDAMQRVPGRMRDEIAATNIAYLAGRLAALEAEPREAPAAPAAEVPELVELRAKAAELEDRGIHLSYQRLRTLAEAHRLPVLRITDKNNRAAWIMAGPDWATLARHIASKPSK